MLYLQVVIQAITCFSPNVEGHCSPTSEFGSLNFTIPIRSQTQIARCCLQIYNVYPPSHNSTAFFDWRLKMEIPTYQEAFRSSFLMLDGLWGMTWWFPDYGRKFYRFTKQFTTVLNRFTVSRLYTSTTCLTNVQFDPQISHESPFPKGLFSGAMLVSGKGGKSR